MRPGLISVVRLSNLGLILNGKTAHLNGKTAQMDLLSRILTSRVRAEIFRLLFGPVQRELHIREIQRRSGLAVGTVRQDLRKLEEIDLVCSRRDGNRLYYCANAEHPLYPELHGLVNKTSGWSTSFGRRSFRTTSSTHLCSGPLPTAPNVPTAMSILWSWAPRGFGTSLEPSHPPPKPSDAMSRPMSSLKPNGSPGSPERSTSLLP